MIASDSKYDSPSFKGFAKDAIDPLLGARYRNILFGVIYNKDEVKGSAPKTLEDIVKRTGEALKSVLETIGNLEKNLFVAHTGVLALQEALERQGAVRPEEVLDLWETKMDERMQAVEKKDRFLERRDRIVAGFGGEDRDDFLRRLREAEFAILALDAARGIKILEELYRALGKEHSALRDFYWTIRVLDGPQALKLRKRIRQEAGMERLR